MSDRPVILPCHKHTLPNGLEIILHENHRLPLVAVNVWYHVGAADEEPGRTGFAHLFEHMMFQGSGHVPEDGHFGLLEAAGAPFINGSTDFDRTNYLEDVPSDQLPLALWLESDRMGFLLDRLDAGMLANQQDVVRNERRQSVEGEPYGLVEETLWQELFPEGHPYRARVIGSHADIQAARLDDVRDFFRRWYGPDNATLCLAGDLEPRRALALVEQYFGTLPRGEPRPPRRSIAPPAITAARRRAMTDRVELPRLDLAWITPAIFTPGDAEATIAARLLGRGKASRLHRRLVHELRLAQSVKARQNSLRLGSVLEITVTAKPGHDPRELEEVVAQEIARLADEGPDAAELAGAIRAIHTKIITGLENPGGFDGLADRLNLYNHHLGEPDRLAWDLERYAAITPEAVARLVRDSLAPDRGAIVHSLPGEKVLPADAPAPPAPDAAPEPPAAGEPWRALPPPPLPAPARPLPAVRRLELDNGLPILLVRAHELPVVATGLFTRAGSAADPPGRAGLAAFTTAMLTEGTATHDALELARALENLGATLQTATAEDGAQIVGRALKASAPELLRLMASAALTPAFAPADVERLRHERLTTLRQQRDQPLRVAMRAMCGALYGEPHPYGIPPLGVEESLRALSLDDLKGFWRSRFAPDRSLLVFAGDLDETQARGLAAQAFGFWRGQGVGAVDWRDPQPWAERIALVDRPGATQATILVGQIGVPSGHADYGALQLMNQVLGGLFTSRVNLNLREDKGWTYGAFSSLPERRGAGPILVGAKVQADAAGAAVVEILREVEGMLIRPLAPRELALARDSLVRALPALFETSFETVRTMGELFLQERPDDHYVRLPEHLRALSCEEVHAATRRHLDPQRLRVVLVGDKQDILAQLRPLALGDVRCLGPDGRRPA